MPVREGLLGTGFGSANKKDDYRVLVGFNGSQNSSKVLGQINNNLPPKAYQNEQKKERKGITQAFHDSPSQPNNGG